MSAPQTPSAIQGTAQPQYAPQAQYPAQPQYAPQAQYPHGQGYPAQPMYYPPAPPVVEEEPEESNGVCRTILYCVTVGVILGLTKAFIKSQMN